MTTDMEELSRKHRKLVFLLGEVLYKLYRSELVRFLYTSDGVKDEEEVDKIISLLGYLDGRIVKSGSVRDKKDSAMENRDDGAAVPAPETKIGETQDKPEEALTADPDNRPEEAKKETDDGSKEGSEERPEERPDDKHEENTGDDQEEGSYGEPETELEEKPEESPYERPERSSEERPYIVPQTRPEERVYRVPGAEPESGLRAVPEIGPEESSGWARTEKPGERPEEKLAEEERVFENCSEEIPAAASETQKAACGSEPLSGRRAGTEDPSDRGDPFGDITRSAIFSSNRERDFFELNLSSLRSEDEKERERGIRNIAHLSDKKTVRRIYRRAIRDGSSLVKNAVLRAIFRFRDKEDEDLYIAALADKDSAVRMTAIRGLSGIATEKSFLRLEELLKDGDQRVRALAGTSLGIYYSERGLERALALCSDESAYVRRNIVDMLGVVDPDGSHDAIAKMSDDRSEEVRDAAAEALKKKGSNRQGKSHGERKRAERCDRRNLK